jgi:hypothetical protein
MRSRRRRSRFLGEMNGPALTKRGYNSKVEDGAWKDDAFQGAAK